MSERLRSYRPFILMFALNLAVLVGVIFVLRRPEPRVITFSTPAALGSPTPALIQVQVSGIVLQPGVYNMPAESRVADAIDRAGGAGPDADLTSLNLARKLSDGEEIRVPSAPMPDGWPAAVSTPPARSATVVLPSGKLNINAASAQDLDLLPGIGPTLAARIVDYRNANGPFKRLEDLKNVKGIGDKLFDGFKELVTLE